MRTKLVIAAVATAAAVSAVGASAYTAGITGLTPKFIGYASSSLTDATFHAQPTFTYSGDATQITGITVVLNSDTTGSALYLNHDAGSAGTATHCSDPSPAYTTGSPGYTTYVCTGLTWDVATTTSIAYALQ